MKKILIALVSILLLTGSGLLGFYVYQKNFAPKKIVSDSEMYQKHEIRMRRKGDVLVIEEVYVNRQMRKGKGIQILDKKRATCSVSKNSCVIEEYTSDGWKNIGKAKLSDILKSPAPKPKGKTFKTNF